MKLETLHDLYMKELRDLYGSEKTLVKSIPKMIDKARLPELRDALTEHLEQTRGHVTRLEQLFQSHKEAPVAKKCKGLEGIIAEGEDDIGVNSGDAVRDAAIIAAADQVEHYEIAAYGMVQSYAIHLGRSEDVKLLQATLDEERAADEKLTQIALKRTHMEATRTA